jgi:hypothetical protein
MHGCTGARCCLIFLSRLLALDLPSGEFTHTLGEATFGGCSHIAHHKPSFSSIPPKYDVFYDYDCVIIRSHLFRLECGHHLDTSGLDIYGFLTTLLTSKVHSFGDQSHYVCVVRSGAQGILVTVVGLGGCRTDLHRSGAPGTTRVPPLGMNHLVIHTSSSYAYTCGTCWL